MISELISAVSLKDRLLLSRSITAAYRERDSITIEYPETRKKLYSDTEWIDELAHAIEHDTYNPSHAQLIDVPKGNGMIRHYSYLTTEDIIRYTELVMQCFPFIMKVMDINSHNPYESLKQYPKDKKWNTNIFSAGKGPALRRKEIQHPDHKFLITIDIANFSPSIDLHILAHDLQNAGVPDKVITELMRMLNYWSLINGRGLPQIYWASDILSAFYLYPIEKILKEHSFGVLRQFDNFDIYGSTDCKEAFSHIIKLFAARGFYFNEKKTSCVQLQHLPVKQKHLSWFLFRGKHKLKKSAPATSRIYYAVENIIGPDCYKRLLSATGEITPVLDHYFNHRINISHSLVRYLKQKKVHDSYQLYTLLRWVEMHPTVIDALLNDAIAELVNQMVYPDYIRLQAAMIIMKKDNASAVINSLDKSLHDEFFSRQIEIACELLSPGVSEAALRA